MIPEKAKQKIIENGAFFYFYFICPSFISLCSDKINEL